MLVCPSIAMAYTVILEDGTQITATDDLSHIQYGMTALQYGQKPIDRIQLDHTEGQDASNPLLVGVAEAKGGSIEAVIRSYQGIHSDIKSTWRFSGLQPFITQKYFEILSSKIDNGANPYVVLELMKNLMPADPEVYDIQFEENKAILATRAVGLMGQMHGVVTLVREDQGWKIAGSQWFSGDQDYIRKKSAIQPVTLSYDTNQLAYKYSDFTKEYEFGRNNPLSLSKTNVKLPKNAITFLFFN